MKTFSLVMTIISEALAVIATFVNYPNHLLIAIIFLGWAILFKIDSTHE